MHAENYAYSAVAAIIPARHYLRMENMFRIRVEKGLSQEDLAAMVGANQATISKIEKGKGNPTLSMINRIAKALGVHPSALFELDPLRQRAMRAIDAIDEASKKEAALIVIESMASHH